MALGDLRVNGEEFQKACEPSDPSAERKAVKDKPQDSFMKDLAFAILFGTAAAAAIILAVALTVPSTPNDWQV